jgi:hypothetical protein
MLSKLINLYKKTYKVHFLTKKYIEHNKKFFLISKKKYTDEIFLIEFNHWQSIHVMNSYLIDAQKSKKNLRFVAFESFRSLNKDKNYFFDNIKCYIGILLGLKNFGVYKSFGVSDFLFTRFDKNVDKLSKLETAKFFSKKIISKKDIENYRINNVYIGDLIYDSYLKKFNKETLEINSIIFKNFFTDCLKIFYFWFLYFDRNKIKGIAVCHGVYLGAIPMRIAVHNNISAYVVHPNKIYYLNKRLFNYREKANGNEMDFVFYKDFINHYKHSNKKYLINGEQILKDIVSGKNKYFYLKKTTYKKNNKTFALNKNKKIKIVILCHSFFDSPHVFGNSFFTDFYEWLSFLFRLIPDTEYDWYIKGHPAFSDKENIIIDNFLLKNNSVTKIPSYTSNLELIKQGINFVLTVYGSAASEFPYFGVNAINASRIHPHIDYNFSITPKNLSDYKSILLNLDKIKNRINKKKLYEFHFAKHYLNKNSILETDIHKIYELKNKTHLGFSFNYYNFWLKNFSIKKHNKIRKNFSNFIKSKYYVSTLCNFTIK